MKLAAGTRLGPYEIQSALGAGGMGEVYRARDPRLERDVAIKVLPAAASADPERLRRFEQEARAAAALNHPNILAVHDIGIHDGSPYIVSELLEGGTLRGSIAAGLPVRKAVDYAIQIARALGAAHDRGIVHRDLKPDNAFVTTTGHVKILDFGLAKLIESPLPRLGISEAPTTPPETEPGLVLGTIGYMAPEQLRGQTVDHRADLFALGALLYEMLSGQRAFPGTTGAEAIAAILDREPPELPVSERKIPPGLARIVERCLEKNPEARFRTAADLAFALEALSASAATREAATAGAAAGAPLGPVRRPWFVAGLSVLATLFVGIPAALYLRPVAPEPVVMRLDVVTPPTTDPFSFAVSPDGRQLVFVANGEKGPQLWLRPLDQVAAQPLAGTEGANYPFWAPDSRALGFFADGRLKRLDLSGGAPQVLASAPGGRGGAWNQNGVIVFSPNTVGGLMRVAATGGTPEAVTHLGTGQGSHRWPHFVTDGRRFLFFVSLGQAQTRGVYVASLDGGEPVRILTAETAAFSASGRLLRVSQGVGRAAARLRRHDGGTSAPLGAPARRHGGAPAGRHRGGGVPVLGPRLERARIFRGREAKTGRSRRRRTAGAGRRSKRARRRVERRGGHSVYAWQPRLPAEQRAYAGVRRWWHRRAGHTVCSRRWQSPVAAISPGRTPVPLLQHAWPP
jgi:hypothetical protein